MSEIPASNRLMELIFEAVNEGLNVLRAGQGLTPFALLLTKPGYVLQRFTGRTTAESLDKAAVTLHRQDENTVGYALIYDALVTVAGRDYDAIMVEAGERGQSAGLRFAQRYQPQSADIPLYTIGQLAFLGQAEQHLA